MKKSLVALAVLGAFAGAASAQSSVTIYGIADVWVGSVDNGAGSVSKVDSGGLQASRLGFKGTEDLGGGLAAIFGLEAGLAIDTGTAGGFKFDRQSFVGFEGGFGQIIAGKVWSAYDDISAASFTGFDSAFTPEYFAFGSTGYSANPNNGFKYTAPDVLGGFGFAVSYALDENNTVDENTTAFHLKYAGGPIYVGAAYQEETAGATKSKFTRVGASYDFGVAKLLGSFGQLKQTGGLKTTDYAFGVDVPLGSTLTLGAGYARGKDNAAKGDEKRDAFGIVATYSLSKRTTAYAGYTTGDGKTAGVKTKELDQYAVGIRHTF